MWARRKLLTGFSFPKLVIGNLICTIHIKFNPLMKKAKEKEKKEKSKLREKNCGTKVTQPVFKLWFHQLPTEPL